jgi:hypothetical protein
MRDGRDPLVLLAEAAQHGSSPALDELLKRLAPSVRSVVRSVLGPSHEAVESTVREVLAAARTTVLRVDPNDVEAEAIEIARGAAARRRQVGVALETAS